jgi:hypothetical protein
MAFTERLDRLVIFIIHSKIQREHAVDNDRMTGLKDKRLLATMD